MSATMKVRLAPASERKKKKKGDPLPEGFVLSNRDKTNKWKVGPSIHRGEMHIICFTEKNSDLPVSRNDAEFVMKYTTGHEYNFMSLEAACIFSHSMEQKVEKWISRHGLAHLGFPKIVDLGSEKHDSFEYGFMVLPRYGTDLSKVFEKNGNSFEAHTVFQLGLALVDTLEYIHAEEFIHANIKLSNIVCDPKEPKRVYLIDYRRATSFSLRNYREDDYRYCTRNDGYGTAAFISHDFNDPHLSFRSDLENLGYCMLHSFGSKLPWQDDDVEDMKGINKKKKHYMKNVEDFLNECLLNEKPYSDQLEEYLKYVAGLDPSTKPDYDRIRRIFRQALDNLHATYELQLPGLVSVPQSSTKKERIRI